MNLLQIIRFVHFHISKRFNCTKLNSTLLLSLSLCIYLNNSYASSPGRALDLDGNGYVSINQSNDLNLSDFTFEAWIKPDSTMNTYYTILSKGDGSTISTNYIFQIQSSKLALYVSESWHMSSSDINPEVWTHVAVTFNNTTDEIKFYINGILDSVYSDSDEPYLSGTNVAKIGEQGDLCNCNRFSGEIDELRIFNVERTEEQIFENMSSIISKNETGLVAYYRFTVIIKSLIIDRSRNKHHGLLVNIDQNTALVNSEASIHSFDGPGGIGGLNGLSDLKIWLKADSIDELSNGDQLDVWYDQSGNNINFEQSNNSSKPIFYNNIINNNPVIRFDGIDDYLLYPSFQLFETNSSSVTIFIVFKADTLSSQKMLFMQPHVNCTNGLELAYKTGDGDRPNFGLHSGCGNASIMQNDLSSSYNIMSIHILSTGQAPDNINIFENGSLQSMEIDNSGWPAAASYGTNANKLIIAARDPSNNGSFSEFHQGDINEIIIYKNSINDASRIIINNYLSSKYDINLNIEDKYEGDLSQNGNFDFDVAGIGKEANGNNYKAKSAGMFLDNNSQFLIDDGDYVLIGHNSMEFTVTNNQSNLPESIIRRWSRIWYLDRTDGGISPNGNIKIGFDFSEVSLTSPSNTSNYSLLYKSDIGNNFSNVPYVSKVRDTNQIIFEISDSNLLDGYYTLGISIGPGSGNALDFDGINDFVDLGNSDCFQITHTFSIEAWFKAKSSTGNYQTIVSKWYSANEANGGSFSISFNNVMGLVFGIQNSNNVSLFANSYEMYDDGLWHHVAGIWNGTTAKLYIDGFLKDSITDAGFGAVQINTRSVRIGSDNRYSTFPNDRQFTGEIDEVRIWRIERTEEQILANMCRRLTGNETCLIGYYRFDNASGYTLTDLSESSNDGILNNMDNSNWITSGAPIGDNSVYDYMSPSYFVSITSNDGNCFTVSGTSGNYSGIQLYIVNESPLDSTPPSNWNSIADNHYWGIFPVGSQTIYELQYNYNGNPYVTDKNLLKIVSRENPSISTFSKCNSNNDKDNEILYTSLSSNIEIAIASGNEPIVIDTISSQSTTTDTSISIGLLITDTESDPCSLSIVGISSYTQLVSNNQISYTCGQEKSYTLNIIPINEDSGTTDITLTITDTYGMTATTSFPLTVIRSRRSLCFDGSNDYGYAEIATTALDNITIEAWVKWDGNKPLYPMIIFSNGNSGSNGYGLFINNLDNYNLGIMLGGSTFYTNDRGLTPDTWEHVAVSRDAGVWRLYINGTLESLTGNNAPITPEGKLTIAGNHVGGEYFKGKIDEFRVWNTALSQLIIKQNLLKQIAEDHPFYNSLVLYYKLNSASGSIAFDSKSNNHLTLLNDDTWTDDIAFSNWMHTGTNNWNQASNWEANAVPSENSPGFVVIEAGINLPVLNQASKCNAVALGDNSAFTPSNSAPIIILKGIYNTFCENHLRLFNGGKLTKYSSCKSRNYDYYQIQNPAMNNN